MDTKKVAAEKAADQVSDGMVVGLGTGTTAYWAIKRLGERVAEGLHIKTVATSEKSELLARQLNIPIIVFSDVTQIDIAIDGADEVDQFRNLIKGGGGALLREKIIAYNSKQFLVIVDHSKLVTQLGKFPLPVEIVPFASELTIKKLNALNANPVIRSNNGKNFITDNGNLIVDCSFFPIGDPSSLNNEIHAIPGVVETGIFLNTYVTSVFVGYETGEVKVI
ncbi:MAG TPA: ribose-5-phosphate isomerase RpiA [Chitinophagaceae bacterium]|nr:ribose-5-phosphate isomerase RpiA [Chitinophagaceae bacterium]